VLKRAVVTVVSNSIPVGIPLVHIVDVLTVVLLVQNAWREPKEIVRIIDLRHHVIWA
jgi:hypothetical protein